MKPTITPRDLCNQVLAATDEFIKGEIDRRLPELDRDFTLDERDRFAAWIMDHISTSYYHEVRQTGFKFRDK